MAKKQKPVVQDPELARLLSIGGQMATLCHNIGVTTWPFEERDRNTMDSLWREWDVAYANFVNAQQSKKTA